MQSSLIHGVTLRIAGIVALAACATVVRAEPADAAAQPAAQPAVAVAVADAAALPAAPAVPVAEAAQDLQDSQVAAADTGLGFGPAADLAQLESSRGGTDVHNDMKLDGVVAGNAAVNVVTGNNTIDSGAFANMQGIPVVIQNSGANVLIQSATIVNLQFQ